MSILRLLLILSMVFVVLPARAAETEGGSKAPAEKNEPAKDRTPSERAARPQRKAVKLSPSIHVLPPQPDEGGKLRSMAPARGESPLQNVPALKDAPPTPGGETPANR